MVLHLFLLFKVIKEVTFFKNYGKKTIWFSLLITKNIVEKVVYYQNLTYTKIITTLAVHDHQLIITVDNLSSDSSHIKCLTDIEIHTNQTI